MRVSMRDCYRNVMNTLKVLHYIFIKRKKPGLLFWFLLGVIERRVSYYCTFCGGRFNPCTSDFNVAEKACNVCLIIARAKLNKGVGDV